MAWFVRNTRCLETISRPYDTVTNIIPRREQWASANQAYLQALSRDTDSLLAVINDLLALNITAEQSAVNDTLARARLLLEVKNARELLAMLCDVGGPGFEKNVTYGCVFYDRLAQLQDQAWRLAEIRSIGLNEILSEPQTESTKSDTSGSNAALNMARSFIGLAQLSLDTMKGAGKQLAAMMERNVVAMTLASVQMGKTAKTQFESLLRELP